MIKLLVDRLGAKPTAFQERLGAAWWREWGGRASDYEYEIVGELCFDFEAHVIGEKIHLKGSAAGEIDVECSRCLKRYRQPFRDDFRLVLEPARERQPPDPEGVESLARYNVYLGDELEAGWYRGKEIALDSFFAEVISLALPVQPLCDESCAGLCPHCGIDLAEASCDCTDQKPDSPFAALAALRRGSGGDA